MPTITLKGETKENTDSISYSVKEGKSIFPANSTSEDTTLISLSGDFTDNTISPTIQRKPSRFEDSNTS